MNPCRFFSIKEDELYDVSIPSLTSDSLGLSYTMFEILKLFYAYTSILTYRTSVMILTLDISDGNTYVFKLYDRYKFVLFDISEYRNLEDIEAEPCINRGFALFKNP